MKQPRESDGVPPNVREHVKRALDTLRVIHARLAQVRGLDERYAGNGRYESETYDSLMGEAKGWLDVLDKFRAAAAQNQVNAELVIKELGGVPDLSRSERAKQYAQRIQGVA